MPQPSESSPCLQKLAVLLLAQLQGDTAPSGCKGPIKHLLALHVHHTATSIREGNHALECCQLQHCLPVAP